jgi:DnaJ-class molecular chaperone
MNAYELLGVDRLADLVKIKQAYRRLAKELHPDVNSGDKEAADRFKHITAAYNLLADAKKRAEYDRNAGRKGGAPGYGAPWEKGGVWYDFEIDETTGERINDLYGDVAGTRLGRVKGAAATSMKVKGQDVAAKLKITETEAREGICKLVTTMTGLSVAVDVPAGHINGKTIKIPGFGIEGFGGAEPGDLNVIVEIVPDPSIEATKP